MRTSIQITALLCCGLFYTSITKAQVANAPDSLGKVQNLQAVEVRGVRAGSNAPFAKTDITAAELEKQNVGQDLPMLLQYTPSAVATSDAGAGVGYTGLRIRGVDATRINVTINGIPVNDAESQQTYFVDLPDLTSSTGSVQLVRGVGTSTNGAGAFGATMSISTLQQMVEAGAVYSSSYGSFNTYKNTLVAGTGMLKGGWQVDVRLSAIGSDGYIQRSASRLRSAQVTAGWKASEKTWLHFILTTGIEKTGQAWNGVPEDSLKANRTYNGLGQRADGTYYNNQTDNYQQDYYQLFADHTFSKYLTGHIAAFLTRGRGYYEEYKVGESFGSYGMGNFVTPSADTLQSTDLVRQLWLDNYNYGSVFSLLYQKKHTQLSLGGSYTQYEGLNYGYVTWAQYGFPDSYKWYQHDAQKNDFNIYLKAQQEINNRLYVYADAQYRNVAYNIKGFRDNPDLRPAVIYNFFNPKAGITYLLRNTNDERQKLYASVAIANREPNHDDFETTPGTLPHPETLYDGEAGYEINKRKWSAGANLYYMYYHDQLVLTGQINDVGAYTQTNVPVSYRAGIELQGAVMPARWLQLQANATFSQNKTGDFTEYIDDYDNGGQQAVKHNNTDLAFSPNTVAAGTITITPFAHRRFSVSLTEKYVGQQYMDNTSHTERSIKAYSFCNALLRYSFNAKPFKEVTATLSLNNIFNQLYETNGYTYPYLSGGALVTENNYFPQAGFNVMGGVAIKL